MGIYDRDYIRMGPRSQSGIGSLRFISFNSWLIIINVAVFLVDSFLLAGAARPVLTYSYIKPEFAHAAVVFDRPPSPLPRAGEGYVVSLYDPQTGNPVGQQRYTMMTPMQNYGHFSTGLGFPVITPRGFPRLSSNGVPVMTPTGMALPEVWRFVTFQFLHASLGHVVMNMFGLWVFGGMVEQFLGFKRYAAFYLTCGVFGAVSYLLLNLIGQGLGSKLPGVLVENPFTPLVGASAGVFGVIMACAFIAPNAIVQIVLLPIQLKLKLFAYGYVALAALNLIRSGPNAGGDAAHMGGAIAGYFFIRNSHLLRDFFDVFGDSRRGGAVPMGRDVGESDVDRILEKVKSEGLASLNDREKSILRRASQRGG